MHCFNFFSANVLDFDEQTADDLDVDMSIYYEENGGDKDSRDLLTMRQSMRRREGIDATDLKTIGFFKRDTGAKIGTFEKYTKVSLFLICDAYGYNNVYKLGIFNS